MSLLMPEPERVMHQVVVRKEFKILTK